MGKILPSVRQGNTEKGEKDYEQPLGTLKETLWNPWLSTLGWQPGPEIKEPRRDIDADEALSGSSFAQNGDDNICQYFTVQCDGDRVIPHLLQ